MRCSRNKKKNSFDYNRGKEFHRKPVNMTMTFVLRRLNRDGEISGA